MYADKLFKNNPTAILFYKEKEYRLISAFSAVAKAFKGKLLFTTSGISHGMQ